MAGPAHLIIDIPAGGGMRSTTCCGASLAPAADANSARTEPLAFLATAFALSILAHSLTLGALPLAGSLLSPAPAFAYLPFIALLAGAFCGARIGVMLIARFGWQVYAATGAVCGSVAALLAACAVLFQFFPLLLVASALLGLAQAMGFGLRHGGAVLAGATVAPLRGGLVLASGALAALAGPWLAHQAEAIAAPYLMVGTFLLVALAHLASLPLAPLLAGRTSPAEKPGSTAVSSPPRSTHAVWAARLTWFAMAAGMAHAPLAMVGCGIAPGGIGSVIAWHVLAMYAPAAPAGLLVQRLGAVPVAIAGSGTAIAGLVLLAVAGTAGSFLAAMVLLGIGWSAATVAAQASSSGAPSMLMRQESGLFAAALAGAVAGIAFA